MGVDVGIVVLVGVDVGVAVNVVLNVGGIGEGVNVDGTGVEAGEHPLNTTVSNAKTRKNDRIVFFMTLSPF
jgi:hypothetical protein